MTDVIRTERLAKYYGNRRGLDGLDLEVREGEIYGFLGPNGAGKTTTIRILMDLIRPSSGTAAILGQDPRDGGPALRRRLGYLAGDFVVDGGQSSRELLTRALPEPAPLSAPLWNRTTMRGEAGRSAQACSPTLREFDDSSDPG